MSRCRRTLPLAALVCLVVASGANCPLHRPVYVPPPRILPEHPSLGQLIEVVNANSAKIGSLASNQATVSVAGLPALGATLAVASDRQLRLRAGTALTGEELDLGSNPELFWLWVKRNQPPGVYFCRHEQFEQSAARHFMPVRPEWIVSALGVVRLDPAGQHEGPFKTSNGNLEIRTMVQDGGRMFRRVTVLEPNAGWVVEQHMLTAEGTLLASAYTSGHVPDPTSGAVVPRHVTIKWPATGMEFGLALHSLQVNPVGLSPELFQLPQLSGYPQVDLGTPGTSPLGIPASQPQPAPGGYSPAPPPGGMDWRSAP